jgi:hypothetical protein
MNQFQFQFHFRSLVFRHEAAGNGGFQFAHACIIQGAMTELEQGAKAINANDVFAEIRSSTLKASPFR